MSSGRIHEFFRKKQSRNHSETAKLLGVSDDYLHNWVRRYAPQAAPKIAKQRGAAKQRGTYAKRSYENDVLAVFLFAYGMHDNGTETHLAIKLGIQVFHRLKRDVVDPLIDADASDDEIRERLNNTLAVVVKHLGRSHQIFIVDRRSYDDLSAVSIAPHVTKVDCGLALLNLINLVAEADAACVEAKRKVA